MAAPKIFVSHSSLDTEFAARLVADLNAAGADAWMDVNDLGAGNFQENISQALADCEWFLLVLTRNALASDWVRMEVDAAIRLKHQKRIKELIFIKVGDVNQHELPALWGVFNAFDATTNYERALTKTLKVIDLLPMAEVAPTAPADSRDGIVDAGTGATGESSMSSDVAEQAPRAKTASSGHLRITNRPELNIKGIIPRS